MIPLLYVFTFFHGVFSAGLIPILRDHVPGWAAAAFGAYFAGLVIGQLVVVVSRGIRTRPWAYAASEAAFGLSLVAMGAGFDYLPWSLIVGRAVEGVAAGMATPLVFELVARTGGLGNAPRRIAIFNSSFVLGFVLGPPVVEITAGTVPAQALLVGAGVATLALCVPMVALLPRALPPHEESQAQAPTSWAATFALLLLAKAVYGFILPYTADYLAAELRPLSVAGVMLVLSGFFVVGQVLAVPILKRSSAWVPVVWLPLILGTVAVVMAVTGMPWLLFPAGIIHSMLLHAGLVAAAQHPGGARDFALVNCLSDPGMVVGSAIAGMGHHGLFAIAALCAATALWRRPR